MAEIDGAGPNDAGTRIRSGVGWDLPESIDCGAKSRRTCPVQVSPDSSMSPLVPDVEARFPWLSRFHGIYRPGPKDFKL